MSTSDPAYNVENFTYNATQNTYPCPKGHTLTTNGTWHKTDNGSRFQQFKTRECGHCPVRKQCTTSKQNGKIVQRRLYAAKIEANRERIENDPEIYKKRQAIVEHPYGTIKRQWGFSYILTKKYLNRASANVGFMMASYNLRRIINIIGVSGFKEYLQKVLSLIFQKMGIYKEVRSPIRVLIYCLQNGTRIFKPGLNRLYLNQNMNFSGGF